MTAFRVARLMCDLCRRTLPGTFADTRAAKSAAKLQAWRTAKMPNRDVIDVCGSCALASHVGYVIHRPPRVVNLPGGSYRTGAFWSRRFAELDDLKKSPQFDDNSTAMRLEIRANPNSKRLMTVEATELCTKVEYEMLAASEVKS